MSEMRDNNRCAVCGWQLDPYGEMCRRGNCSHRPLPDRFYDPERVNAEYGNHAPVERDPYRPTAPALTRDEAARRLTPGVLRVVLKHVNDTANDAFYTATVGLDLPDDEVPLFVANATASLLHDEIMIHLYGLPVETPTKGDETP